MTEHYMSGNQEKLDYSVISKNFELVSIQLNAQAAVSCTCAVSSPVSHDVVIDYLNNFWFACVCVSDRTAGVPVTRRSSQCSCAVVGEAALPVLAT